MAASTILSDNGVLSGSAGIKPAGGNDGTLVLQTTTSGGVATAALTIDTSQNITFANQPTYSGGTANGVAYLNGSKVLTTGTALVFTGTNLGVGNSSPSKKLDVTGVIRSNGATDDNFQCYDGTTTTSLQQSSNYLYFNNNVDSVTAGGFSWRTTSSYTTRMVINSSGYLGLGTATPSSPDGTNAANPLNGITQTVYGSSPALNLIASSSTGWSLVNFGRNGGTTNPYRAVIGYDQANDTLVTNARNALVFKTGVALDSATEYMRITSSGGVAFNGSSNYGTSGQVLTSAGNAPPTWSTPSSGLPGTLGQVFTSTGTFTVPSGVTAVKVTVVGGGGGGANSTIGNSVGGGGGGGGTAIKYITGLTPGASITATVGASGAGGSAGGTSSFGAYCSATGGSAGTAPGGSGNGSGGAGGAGSSGDFNRSGGSGANAFGNGLSNYITGGGGSDLGTTMPGYVHYAYCTGYYYQGYGAGGTYGSGGRPVVNDGNGSAGGVGCGGSGATKGASTNRTGGAGGTGIIIVEW